MVYWLKKMITRKTTEVELATVSLFSQGIPKPGRDNDNRPAKQASGRPKSAALSCVKSRDVNGAGPTRIWTHFAVLGQEN